MSRPFPPGYKAKKISARYTETSGKRGRPETFSDAAIQTCLTFKVLFGFPLSKTVGLVESPIRMAALDWPVPDFSRVFRRQARIAEQIPYRASGQLHAHGGG